MHMQRMQQQQMWQQQQHHAAAERLTGQMARMRVEPGPARCDTALRCADCRREFMWTAAEQALCAAQPGGAPPYSCRDCASRSH